MCPLPVQTRANRPLIQKIGDLGNNAVPDLRDGILVEGHKDGTHHDDDEHHDEPAGHLVAAWIGQHICGFDSRRINFVFYSFEHDKYLRFFIWFVVKEKGEALLLRCANGLFVSSKGR